MTATGPGEDTGSVRRTAVWLIVLPILGILGLLLGLIAGVSGGHVPMLGLAIATVLLSSVPLVLDQARPPERRSVFLSLFALWFMAMYVVPVFANYLLAEGPAIPGSIGGQTVLPPDIVRAQAVVLAGFAALLLGYYATPGRFLARMLPQPSHDWPHETILIAGFSMLLLGWLVRMAGIVGVIPKELGSGVVGAIAALSIYAVVVLTIDLIRRRSAFGLALITGAVVLSSFIGFFTGSKKQMLIAPAMVVLTSMLVRGRIRGRWIVAGVLALTLLYPTAIFYREVILVNNTLTAIHALRDLPGTISRVGDFVARGSLWDHLDQGREATANRVDGLGVTSVIIRDTPSVSPFQNGRTLVLFFIAFVPRIFWPDKPDISLGQWITDVYGPGPIVTSRTGPTAIGDLYLNLGVAGVVAGMLLLGAILRLAQESLLGHRRTVPTILAGVVLLLQLVLKFMGSVALSWSTTLLALVPIVLIHFGFRFLGLTRVASPAEPERLDGGLQSVSPWARDGSSGVDETRNL